MRKNIFYHHYPTILSLSSNHKEKNSKSHQITSNIINIIIIIYPRTVSRFHPPTVFSWLTTEAELDGGCHHSQQWLQGWSQGLQKRPNLKRVASCELREGRQWFWVDWNAGDVIWFCCFCILFVVGFWFVLLLGSLVDLWNGIWDACFLRSLAQFFKRFMT